VTIAQIVIPAAPVAHGFRPGRGRGGHAVILRGNSPEHEKALDAYQDTVRTAARQWLHDHRHLVDSDGRWTHYRSPIVLGFVAWIRRPSTYKAADVWHDTASTGDLTTLKRAAEDALTGIMYHDDSQVAYHVARYLPQPPTGTSNGPPASHPVVSAAPANAGEPSIPGLSSPLPDLLPAPPSVVGVSSADPSLVPPFVSVFRRSL
jgi:hypothetical protein